jgi:hypothetical protein
VTAPHDSVDGTATENRCQRAPGAKRLSTLVVLNSKRCQCESHGDLRGGPDLPREVNWPAPRKIMAEGHGAPTRD